MPRENTHLFFADKAKRANKELLNIIDKHIDYYNLGSVFPDTFFYSAKASIRTVSDHIHGKDGNSTNEIIFKILDKAKEIRDDKLFAFALGYLTHCYLDITFHPVIYYLTGNYYDKDVQKRDLAIYNHRYMETILDMKLNREFKFNASINWRIFGGDTTSLLSDILEIKKSELRFALFRQYLFNFLFRNRFAYFILNYLARFIKIDKSILPLFYSYVDSAEPLEDELHYKDLFSGAKNKKTIKELIDIANQKSRLAMYSAYKYYRGQETKIETRKIIAGESLDTGYLNSPVEGIRYYL